MMRLIVLPALGAAMMLAACQQEEEAPAEPAMEEPATAEFAIKEPPSNEYASPSEPPARSVAADVVASPPAPGDSAREPLQTGNGLPPGDIDIGRPPQIAYVYDFGFRLSPKAIAPLQMQHADLCEAKGPDVCRIISLEHSGPEGEFVEGTLQLAVATAHARGFGKELADAVTTAEGEQISTSITGEDLAKKIVDTEAHLKARKLLRDRLMEVLRTRRGSVEEIVRAERDVAEINREIDLATSGLADMRGRAAFSRMNLHYESGSPSAGGFMDPIRSAAADVGATLGWFIAALISLLTILVPLGAIGLAARFAWRRLGLAVPGRPASGDAAG